MPQGPVAMPEIKRGPNENEKRIGFIISEEEAKRINLFDYTKNNAPKKHHSGHKESGFWSTTAYEVEEREASEMK